MARRRRCAFLRRLRGTVDRMTVALHDIARRPALRLRTGSSANRRWPARVSTN